MSFAGLRRWASSLPKWAWVVGGLVLLALVVAGSFLFKGSGSSVADQDSTYGQHPEDVKVVSCALRGGYPAASLRVTNSSADESTYAIQLSFQAPDGQAIYDSRTVIVSELQPEQTSAVQQVKGSTQIGGKPLTCVVARAARYGT